MNRSKYFYGFDLILIVALTVLAYYPTKSQAQDQSLSIENLRAGSILITPLLDLRGTKIDPTSKTDIDSKKQRITYAESLGEILFANSRKHRVRTSGEAFDQIINLKTLNELARTANSGKPLPATDSINIGSILSGFQYLIFFSLTNDEAKYEYARENPTDADGFLVQHTYTAKRLMIVKIAVWDIKNNQITHVAEVNAIPEARKSIFVKTEKKMSPYIITPSNYDLAIAPDIHDRKPTSSLETERSVHRNRFPPLPDRDPEFTNALRNFMPTQPKPTEISEKSKPPSRQNDHKFENNLRMELNLKSTLMGVLPLPNIFLGAATLKWKILRIGGGIEFSPLGTMIDHEVRLYEVFNSCFSLSADVEWQLGSNNRILTGAYYGAGVFTYKQSDLLPDLDGTKSKSQSDGYIYRAPRVRYLRGAHEGLQFGIGVYQHYYDKLEKPELLANHPYKYGLELVFAAAIGG